MQVIRFMTDHFDVSLERPNDLNPIPGESLLKWLAARASDTVVIPEAETEDWGWYSDINWNGRSYMLGASASDPEPNGKREWVLQIHKQRSITERLLGKERQSPADPCFQFFLALVRSEPAFSGVVVE